VRYDKVVVRQNGARLIRKNAQMIQQRFAPSIFIIKMIFHFRNDRKSRRAPKWNNNLSEKFKRKVNFLFFLSQRSHLVSFFSIAQKKKDNFKTTK
jgi:hypothetical protein